ncbi:MAG: DUF362 domain-containing protein [Bacteroidales bacterium]|nr:DUF362 domain-containing protein [Bacteroidales bacterium]
MKKATVYMTKKITSESLIAIYEKLGVPAKGRVAVKISTGEPGGHHFLDAKLIAPLVQKVHGTIVECNTAYGGARDTTEGNLQAAKDHGYCDIAKVDIMDSEGEMKIPVRDSKYLKYDIIGTHAANYDFVINLAHFKGHTMGGFGGVLKNQSIGFSSSNGKAYQHSTGKAETVAGFNALLMTTVEEGQGLECADWVAITHSHDIFHECMANCAAAVADYYGPENIIYIDVMNNLSVDCDCDPNPSAPEMGDIGIFASLDPVALDQACVDQVFNYASKAGDDSAALIERITSRHGIHTVEHAEAIGLGTRQYELVSID